MIFGVWTLAGILSMVPIFVWPEPKTLPEEKFVCKINQQIGHVIVATVGILYIPAIIMIVLYWRIFVIASRHLKSSSKGVDNVGGTFSYNSGHGGQVTHSTDHSGDHSDLKKSSNASSSNGNGGDMDKGQSGSSQVPLVTSSSSKQILLAKKLFILVGSLLISYIPFFTMFLINAFKPGAVPLNVFIAFGWIRYFNSCINPVIYAFAVPAYRKALNNIVLRGKLCP